MELFDDERYPVAVTYGDIAENNTRWETMYNYNSTDVDDVDEIDLSDCDDFYQYTPSERYAQRDQMYDLGLSWRDFY